MTKRATKVEFPMLTSVTLKIRSRSLVDDVILLFHGVNLQVKLHDNIANIGRVMAHRCIFNIGLCDLEK